ncbi:Mov34/MPN/PAD-1 family protein [Sorangium sp. So ce269]
MKKEVRFQSSDGRFTLSLKQRQVNDLLRLSRQAGRRETGGVLVGYYNESLDCAQVTQVSKPPRDSQGSWSRFERGTEGLREWLAKLWGAPKRTYYLGEWHFHPYALPEASAQDRSQMVAISKHPAYSCPEPLLLILGGDPGGDWEARAYVFPIKEGCVELHVVRTTRRG